jgi:hypothetical protein
MGATKREGFTQIPMLREGCVLKALFAPEGVAAKNRIGSLKNEKTVCCEAHRCLKRQKGASNFRRNVQGLAARTGIWNTEFQPLQLGSVKCQS